MLRRAFHLRQRSHRVRLLVDVTSLAEARGSCGEIEFAVEVRVVAADAQRARRIPVGRELQPVVVAVGIDSRRGAVMPLAAMKAFWMLLLDIGIEDRRRDVQAREERVADADLVVGCALGVDVRVRSVRRRSACCSGRTASESACGSRRRRGRCRRAVAVDRGRLPVPGIDARAWLWRDRARRPCASRTLFVS